MGNYYEILGLEARQHDTLLNENDVKTAYKRALLQHHPDKSSKTTRSTSSTVTVDDIALACKTIVDPGLRAEYDRVLLQCQAQKDRARGTRTHRTGLETADLDALVLDHATQTWSRSCRCGEPKGFIVTEAELDDNVADGELMVGCKGCSLWLKVLFSIEE